MDADALVRDYLGRLDAAAMRLPRERRAELEAEVRDHIEAALEESGARDEVTVRNMLDRLGSPDEIVAAENAGGAISGAGSSGTVAFDPSGAQTVARPAAPGWGAIEIIALLLLTVGSIVLPFVGPLLGLVFVWLSDRWNGREKLMASAIVLVLLILPLALFFGASTSGGLNGPQVGPAATAGP